LKKLTYLIAALAMLPASFGHGANHEVENRIGLDLLNWKAECLSSARSTGQELMPETISFTQACMYVDKYYMPKMITEGRLPMTFKAGDTATVSYAPIIAQYKLNVRAQLNSVREDHDLLLSFGSDDIEDVIARGQAITLYRLWRPCGK
jgi:hypothetical protein